MRVVAPIMPTIQGHHEAVESVPGVEASSVPGSGLSSFVNDWRESWRSRRKMEDAAPLHTF